MAHKIKASNLKKLQIDDTSMSNALIIAKEKLTSDPTQAWHDSEVLYSINIQKKGGIFSISKPSDKYLLLLKTEDARIYIIIISLSGKEFNIKFSWDMKSLRGIDTGDLDTDIVLSFENADYTWVFRDQVERDETLWIMTTLAKKIYASDLYSGTVSHLTSLAYAATSNGILTRFPLLESYCALHDVKELSTAIGFGSNSSSSVYPNNSSINEEEEMEAELLLEELNWDVSGESPDVFRKQMNQQADSLHVEIINFLLQWEEDEETSASGSAGTSTTYSSPPKLNSLFGEIIEENPTKVASLSLPEHNMRKVTMEVMGALSSVDEQLSSVDEWLGEQISRLSEIQSKLHMIEAESGQLETSWYNLSNLKHLVSIVIEELSLSEQDEELLLTPQVVVETILKDPEVKDRNELLLSLLNALDKMRSGLAYKGAGLSADATSPANQPESNPGSPNSTMSPGKALAGTQSKSSVDTALWKELMGVMAVSSQRHKLMELADGFCNNLSDSVIGSLFDRILKHRYLAGDPDKRYRGVTIKQYNLAPLVMNALILCSPSSTIRIGQQVSGGMRFNDGRGANSCTVWYTRQIVKDNQLLQSQKMYHDVVHLFAPLLCAFLELAPTLASTLFSSYTHSTGEKFYNPLLKVLFQNLLSECNGRTAHPVSLHNVVKSGLQEKTDPLVKLRLTYKAGTNQFSPWIGFELLLQLMAPVIKREIEFCKTIFEAEFKLLDEEAVDKKLEPLLDILFEGFSRRLVKFIDAGSDSDGCETTAMLAVLEWFMAPEKYFFNTSDSASDNGSEDGSVNSGVSGQSESARSNSLSLMSTVMGVTKGMSADEILEVYACPAYLMGILDNIRITLLEKLEKFIAEQLTWLDHQLKVVIRDKKYGVLLPFEKFPSLIDQLVEMTGGLELDYISNMYCKLCEALLAWLDTVADANVKYFDVILIHNLGYFVDTMGLRGVRSLNKYVSSSMLKRAEAESRYINWMIAYECPGMSNLADRINGVSGRVNKEELGLYVPRKEVTAVFKELTPKALEANIISMKKRLEKHCGSSEGKEMHLASNMWGVLKSRVVKIFKLLEDVGQNSYQTHCELNVDMIRKIFDNHVNTH